MKLATLLVLGVAASLATVPRGHAQEPATPPPAASPTPAEATAWLGVSSWPVSPAKAQEFKLTEGFHLTLIEVAPESPAAKAGLKAGDILLRLDDQILINPSQLRSLIRSRKPGDSVKLAFRRGGEAEQTLVIPLGVKVSGGGTARETTPTPVDLMEMLSRSSGLPDLEPHMRILSAAEAEQGSTAGYATVARSDESGTIHLSRNESGMNLRCVDAKGNVVYQGPINTPAERSQVPAEWLHKADQLGAGVKVVSQAPIRRRVILPNGAPPSLSLQNTDETGTITLSLNQGSKNIRCVDPMGKILFEGPINTAEERAKAPVEWLNRADRLNVPIQSNLSAERGQRRAILPNAETSPRDMAPSAPLPSAPENGHGQ